MSKGVTFVLKQLTSRMFMIMDESDLELALKYVGKSPAEPFRTYGFIYIAGVDYEHARYRGIDVVESILPYLDYLGRSAKTLAFANVYNYDY